MFKDPGDYRIIAEVALPQGESGIRVGTPQRSIDASVQATGDYYSFQQQSLGKVTIQQPGSTTFQIKPIAGSWQAVNLRSLRLIEEAPSD